MSALVSYARMKPISRREMLRTSILLSVELAAGGLLAFRVGAQEPVSRLPASAEKLVRDYMREFSVPGLQLAYVRGTRVLYSGGFGNANRANTSQ